MTVDTMRRIDRYAGVPICFFLSIFSLLFGWLRFSRKKAPDVSRTLFIELSEMGSTIIADPAMKKLRKQGNAKLYFAIFKENYKSLEILNTIPPENVFVMDASNFFKLTGEVIRFIFWCRRKKITCVVDLELFSRFTAILSFFSGALYRVGFASYHDEGLYRGRLINRPVRYNPHVHMSVNFMSLVNRALHLFDNHYATVPVTSVELKLDPAPVNREAQENVKTKIRRMYPEWAGELLIIFNVNASDMLPQRRWMPEYFAEVAAELLKKYQNILLVFTGAPAEREYVQNVINMISDKRCINSAGIFLFEELVPLYQLSTFMITNDSGPAHFAAVTPLKVFVLFGPETPNLYLPMGNAEAFYLGLPCSPCVSAANHRKTTCITRPCIATISPGMVSGRLSEYLTTRDIR
jgi:ADP-heptose:LPS heptosyltransferase